MADKGPVLFIGQFFFDPGDQFVAHKAIKQICFSKIGFHILTDVCGNKIPGPFFVPVPDMGNRNNHAGGRNYCSPVFVFSKNIIPDPQRTIGHVNMVVFFCSGKPRWFADGNDEFIFYLRGINGIGLYGLRGGKQAGQEDKEQAGDLHPVNLIISVKNAVGLRG